MKNLKNKIKLTRITTKNRGEKQSKFIKFVEQN